MNPEKAFHLFAKAASGLTRYSRYVFCIRLHTICERRAHGEAGMNIFNFDMVQFLGFLLTLMRISIVVFMLPVFATDWLPAQVKAAICLVLTLAVWPLQGVQGVLMPGHPFEIGLMIAGEILIGLVLGMTVNCFFMGIQSGGEILAMQMGFSMITFADPLSGANTGIIAHFLYMVSMLIFLTLGGHLILLKAFSHSFAVVPPGSLIVRGVLMNELVQIVGMVFVFAIRIAAPVMAVLILVEVALGLMNRAAPQIPVMEIGFPLKIALGFFFMGFLFLIMSDEVRNYIIGLDALFLNLLKAMGPVR